MSAISNSVSCIIFSIANDGVVEGLQKGGGVIEAIGDSSDRGNAVVEVCTSEQDKRSPNRPRLAGIRQINFGENHTFQDLNRNFNHLGSFKMPDLV